MIDYAPIIIFAYNRTDRLKALLKSLEKNDSTEDMRLFIFVDVPDRKDRKNLRYNEAVQEFINNYRDTNDSFKEVTVIIANRHKGLAESVISGVSRVINKYGKAIILEDDLEVSKDFLDYMQRGLCFYQHDKRVWSVAGHCPQMHILNNYKKDVFLAPRAESLGWGTWKDRWNRTDWQVATYEKFQRDIVGRVIFNLGGNDLSATLKKQMEDEKFDSWAIRWCYQQFLERRYTVYPRESRVIHCGNDSRSTHGSYFSTQKLREKYKRCQFEFVRPGIRMIWNFRKANSVSHIKKVLWWK